MGSLPVLGGAALLMSAAMAGAWGVRRATGQSGWIDAIWSSAIGVAGAAAALAPITGGAPSARQWLCAAMAGCWSLRLASHIFRRAASAKHDDPRYADLKRQWGDRFATRLFLFLQIQALCGLGLAATVLAAAHRPGTLDLRDALGLALLVGAVVGEGVADAQLTRFAADPANKGKVCDVGLWRWSRHPNYFFEWLGWFAYPLIAIQPGYPLGWLALIGPVLLYWLLVHASGVPPLEAHMLRSRGSAFADYQRRTSVFLPLPPKAGA